MKDSGQSIEGSLSECLGTYLGVIAASSNYRVIFPVSQSWWGGTLDDYVSSAIWR